MKRVYFAFGILLLLSTTNLAQKKRHPDWTFPRPGMASENRRGTRVYHLGDGFTGSVFTYRGFNDSIIGIPQNVISEIYSKINPSQYSYALAEAAFLKACYPAKDYMIGSIPRPNAYSAEFYFRSRSGAIFGVYLLENWTVADIFVTNIYEADKLIPQKRSLLYFVAPKCNLNLTQAPEIRGFHLGMTSEQVVDRFPKLEIEPASSFPGTQAQIRHGNWPRLEGISSVRLKFFDDRLFSILIEYDGSTKWNSTDEFVSRLSEALSLPTEWQANGISKYERQSLECADFRLIAEVRLVGIESKSTTPLLMMEDLTAQKKIENRQKEIEQKQRKEEEERRRTFKP